MITLAEITMAMGGRTLFEKVSCAFSPHNRYGLTGPNGSGKSTLLKIIMGVISAICGTVTKPKRVGFLKQNIHDFLHLITLDVVIQGNDRLWQALQEREKLYDVEMTDEVGLKLGELESIVAEEDGYSAEANAQTLLSGIGVPEEYHN